MDTIDHQHLAGESALLQLPKQLDQPCDIAVGSQLHVVILGAGFAGLSVAKALAKAPVHVTLIDQRNYHLFQPLLYQVATAGLSPADIAMPIRSILSRQRHRCPRTRQGHRYSDARRIDRRERDPVRHPDRGDGSTPRLFWSRRVEKYRARP